MILTAFLAVLLGFVAVLAVPLEMDFLLSLDGARVAKRLRFVWLFGLVRKEPRGRGVPAGRRRRRAGREPEKRLALPRLRAALGSPGLLPRLRRLLGQVVARVARFRLRLSVRFGLDDPADTGRIHGIVAPWLASAPRTHRLRLLAVPVFDEATLEVRAEGSLRVTPLRLVASMLGFLFSIEVLRAAWRVAAVKA